ncbi:hypothetical protein CH249_06975 [Rhodococcus sp. 05-2255-3B1]|nr:hypothetical protein CH250_11030 [Rhodococcus sp. 05-2255-3C]OZE14166.1 hypothetical protein CH249_06975 [Rhodococcus sp. 05-2255-3B1]OZE24737.1 hypothetical protein CH255_00850 [Rhodococcus sp. 05-2255-2A2]
MKFGSVDGRRGPTEFGILGDDGEVQFFGLPAAGVALERNRVAFRAATDSCLLLGTDADVDDGSATCLTLGADCRRDDLRFLGRGVPGAEFFEDRLPSTGVPTGAAITPESFWWCRVGVVGRSEW